VETCDWGATTANAPPHDCLEDGDENSQSSSLRIGQVSQRIAFLLAPRCQAVLIVTHTKIFVLQATRVDPSPQFHRRHFSGEHPPYRAYTFPQAAMLHLDKK